MGYGTVNPPVTPHEHSDNVGDGGRLDANETKVDTYLFEEYVVVRSMGFR